MINKSIFWKIYAKKNNYSFKEVNYLNVNV